jgi:seryl-tRNA synthetase
MLDVKKLRSDPKLFKDNYKVFKDKSLLKKVDKVVELYEKELAIKKEIDDLRSQRNTFSKEVSKLKKEGKDASKVLKKVKDIPNKIKAKEEELIKARAERENLLHIMPNVVHKKVPYGKGDEDNVEIKKWGKKPKFTFPIKNHVELLEELGAVDFDSSAKVSGNGFYYLKGDFALLNQALIRYAVDFMIEKKYTYVEVPLMLRSEKIAGAGDVSSFEQSIYKIEKEDLALIGTSEHGLLAMHDGQVLTNLPKKYFSYSMCFRKEIGAHGINEKGLWRTHQFNKVEMFVFCAKEDSWKFYDEMVSFSEELFKALELPYRILEICTGDLALWKARSCDFEVWRPTTKEYGEITSLSNCTDYQARNLGIRYDGKEGREVVHTLNNTAIATSRILVAIAENYQQEDGSIRIPKVLQKYMAGKKVIGKA